MRLFKQIGISVLSLLCLCSCGAGKGYYDKAVNDLKGRLKDPSSLVISSADAYTRSENGKTDWGCKIVYNAKNSYGAYVGNRAVYYYLDSSNEVKYDGTSSFFYVTLSGFSDAKHETYK